MSEAREEILARVRAAVGGAAAPDPVATRTPTEPRPPEQLVELFAERVADYRAVVQRCAPGDLAEAVRAALPVDARVVVPAELGLEVPGALVDGAGGRWLTAAELDAVDAVVTEARVGIAETGTVVLDHAAGQGRRALTLVPDRHVCIVRADQVVADVPDAFAVLDPLRPQTWISGPSATSDIELDRVEGVHGPRNLVVVVVG